MSRAFVRTELLLGEEAMRRLQNARVAVFGVGGVGGYVVEALARSGVGALDLIDNDTVAESNLNRQIIALRSTIGQYKTDVAKARILDINPDCRVTVYHTFYLPETTHTFDFSQYDYIVDAIDTVKGKLALVEQAQAAGTPVICSMGAGNKLDPTRFEVADIYKTSVCPLARVMRYECKKRGVKRLKVVYSKEPPVRPVKKSDEQTVRRDIPGSTAFVPSVAGLIIAGEVIKDMIGCFHAAKNSRPPKAQGRQKKDHTHHYRRFFGAVHRRFGDLSQHPLQRRRSRHAGDAERRRRDRFRDGRRVLF